MQAVAKTFAGKPYISSSATNASLTIGAKRIKSFWRVVVNDVSQAATDVEYIGEPARRRRSTSSTTRPRTVPARGRRRAEPASHRRRRRPRIGQPESRPTSRRSSRRSPSDTDVVFLPWQIAANAQLFDQQLERAGQEGDPRRFRRPLLARRLPRCERGVRSSAFAPDLHNAIAARTRRSRRLREAVRRVRSNFGPPAYVAMQVSRRGLKAACADGTATRSEVIVEGAARRTCKTSILG